MIVVLLLKAAVAAIALWTALLLGLLFTFIYKATHPPRKN